MFVTSQDFRSIKSKTDLKATISRMQLIPVIHLGRWFAGVTPEWSGDASLYERVADEIYISDSALAEMAGSAVGPPIMSIKQDTEIPDRYLLWEFLASQNRKGVLFSRWDQIELVTYAGMMLADLGAQELVVPTRIDLTPDEYDIVSLTHIDGTTVISPAPPRIYEDDEDVASPNVG
jgi:hypothetical protein